MPDGHDAFVYRDAIRTALHQKMLFAHISAPQNGQLLHYAAWRTSHDSNDVIDLVLQHRKNLEVNDIDDELSERDEG